MDGKYMSPIDWNQQNDLYCQSRPKFVSKLTHQAINQIINPVQAAHKAQPVPEAEQFAS